LLYLLVLSIAFSAPFQSVAQPPNPVDQFVALVNARRAAVRNHDVEVWKKLVATDCVWVEPSGRTEGWNFHVPRPASSATTLTTESSLSDYQLRLHGDTAVLTYREDAEFTVGDAKSKSVVRFTEVFHRNGDSWMLVHSAETPIVERTGIKVDPATFKDYIGDYQIAPGLVGTVYIENGKLLLNSKGWRKPYELVPLSATTFFVRGFETTEIEFVRDASGKVTHHVSRSPSSDPMIAKKID
jgi:ketosteroid isomerase-like protein